MRKRCGLCLRENKANFRAGESPAQPTIQWRAGTGACPYRPTRQAIGAEAGCHVHACVDMRRPREKTCLRERQSGTRDLVFDARHDTQSAPRPHDCDLEATNCGDGYNPGEEFRFGALIWGAGVHIYTKAEADISTPVNSGRFADENRVSGTE